MKQKIFNILIVGFVAILQTGPLFAEGEWKIGGGLILEPSPFVGSDKIQPELIPFVFYEGERFFWIINEIGYSVYKTHRSKIDLVSSIRFEGFEPSDSTALEGMDARDAALDAGIQLVNWGLWGMTKIRYLADISGIHKGHEVSASYELPISNRVWEITPSIGVMWKSSALVDYYYGVRAAEAIPDRPAFSGKDAVNCFIGLDGTYKLTTRWWILTGLQTEMLSNEITSSPIVDDQYQVAGYIGILHEL